MLKRLIILSKTLSLIILLVFLISLPVVTHLSFEGDVLGVYDDWDFTREVINLSSDYRTFMLESNTDRYRDILLISSESVGKDVSLYRFTNHRSLGSIDVKISLKSLFGSSTQYKYDFLVDGGVYSTAQQDSLENGFISINIPAKSSVDFGMLISNLTSDGSIDNLAFEIVISHSDQQSFLIK